MCKVLMMIGVDNPANAKAFMDAAKTPMSFSDRDGIGYAITKSDGSFFSERWHKNDHYMNRDKVMTAEVSAQLAPFKDRLPLSSLDVNYSSVGNIDFSDIRSVLMHTRMATCGRTFENTHPFIIDNNVLIHNGVIRNSHKLTNKISTCDSETALNEYLSLGVNTDSSNVQHWINQLEGYWAFGIFSTDANNNRILDLVRSGASLYFCRIPEIGENSLIVATTRKIIDDAVAECKFTIANNEVNTLAEHHFHRFNAVTGELMEVTKIEDSVLNKVVPVYKGWSGGNYGSSEYGTGYKGYSSNYKGTSKYKPKKNVHKTFGEAMGFYEQMDAEDEALILEMCSDVSEPLIDMLYMYDDCLGTDYGAEYESLDHTQMRFLEAAFKDKTMTFVDIIDMLDSYWEVNGNSKDGNKCTL